MAWTEKYTPSPFDEQPISGLFFLDGDLIARTQEPGLPPDWAKEFQGLKYPVVIFPSGAEASVTSDEGEILVCIHRQMRLPYFDTRDHAYERAKALAEDHQDVDRVGETGLVLRLDDPNTHVLVIYDNEERHISDLNIVDTTTSEAERLVYLKDELLEGFRELPPEHQATMGLVLVKTILAGELGAWFADALARTSLKPMVVPSVDQEERSEPSPSVFPTNAVTKEDLIFARPDLEETITALSDTSMKALADKVGESLQELYWTAVDIVLAASFPDQDHSKELE